MTERTICSRYVKSTQLVSLAALFLGCAGPADQGIQEDVGVTAEAWTELPPDQVQASRFFAYDNVVNITINLADDVWEKIKTVEPSGGTPENPKAGECKNLPITPAEGNGSNNEPGESPDRYDWSDAGTVTVSDSKGMTPVSFTSVQIRKKSYCGSLTTLTNETPSLKLKFKSDLAQKTMGVQYLTLNNSKQDPTYIRQTLGYQLMGMAQLPRPRANYAKVKIVTPRQTQDYVYVNVESLRGSFINNSTNNFLQGAVTSTNGQDAIAKGNLYELSIGAEFNAAGLEQVGTEKISAIKGTARPDLTYAIQQLAGGTATAATLKTVIDVDQFAKFWAMEVLLKESDGYTSGAVYLGANNTYVYNDVVATSGTQSDATVNFKFIPMGLDQILMPTNNFRIDNSSVIGKIMRNDPTLYAKFVSQVAWVRDNVLSRELLDSTILPRIKFLQDQLKTLGIDTPTEIDKIRRQLKLARAAAIKIAGAPTNTNSYYIADIDSGDVIQASNSEWIASNPDNLKDPNAPHYYEIYHAAPTADASQRWITGSNSLGTTFKNEAYTRNMHAAQSLISPRPAAKKFILQTPPGTSDIAQAWLRTDEQVDPTYNFAGTFTLRSVRTNEYVHFSQSDKTPAGYPRINQTSVESYGTHMFMY